MAKYFIFFQIIILSIIPELSKGQNQSFSLEECINYAWKNSTEVIRANNNNGIQAAYLVQSKAARGANLYLKGNQTLSSTNSYQDNGTNADWSNSNDANLSISLSSEIILYNGAKLKNTITQSQTNLAASVSDIQTQKELISLNVLTSYINTLLATENVDNYQAQLQSTEKQLEMAKVRRSAGIISISDFLNIKSQYASDKASLVDSKNSLRTRLVDLMQLMNMPINNSFNIQKPDIDPLLKSNSETDANLIYKIALGLQPSIESAKLNVESARMDIKIAKADALPQLSLGGSIGTGYTTAMDNINFGEQFSNKITPSIGLTLSIPIFQRKKVKTNVAIANIQTQNEELALIDLKNDLRKYIEQACIDAQTASSNYLALQEQYEAQNESYQLSDEMFTQGMLNSIDFLTSKNNLVTAEKKLTQAKYNVLLQHKIIDYYMGDTILF